MELLENGVIAFLAAVGLTALLWGFAGLVLRRRPRPVEALLVLPARADGETLEMDVRTLETFRQQIGPHMPIVVADRGLSETGRRRAQLLAEQVDGLTVLPETELRKILR